MKSSVIITALIVIGIVECVALYVGINGFVLTIVVGAICALAGAAYPTPKFLKGETVKQFDRADATVKRLEEANKATEELLKRQEAVAARMLLSGKTDAGQTTVDPKVLEQTRADEEAKKIVDRFKTS